MRRHAAEWLRHTGRTSSDVDRRPACAFVFCCSVTLSEGAQTDINVLEREVPRAELRRVIHGIRRSSFVLSFLGTEYVGRKGG